tara:strand:- start:609 stop:1037 length:429 start_codon:yes stop_codon:yes gene_type:complete
MDKGYEKERFTSLSIKTSVVDKFNRFCKEMGLSKSMTLLVMIDFFKDNGISPVESFGLRMETLESRISTLIKKRMNGMIAIMKNIEKTQTKPTTAMLLSLFEQTEPPKKTLIVEKKYAKENKEVQFRKKKNFHSNDDGQWKK